MVDIFLRSIFYLTDFDTNWCSLAKTRTVTAPLFGRFERLFCGETGSVDILNSGRYFCEVAPGFGRYFNLVVDILIQEKKVGKANNTLVF